MLLRRESFAITKKQLFSLFILGGVLFTLQALSFFSAVLFGELLSGLQWIGACAVIVDVVLIVTGKQEKQDKTFETPYETWIVRGE